MPNAPQEGQSQGHHHQFEQGKVESIHDPSKKGIPFLMSPVDDQIPRGKEIEDIQKAYQD
jgi:hypothetical protein